jgi:hypothetical protein
VIATHNPLVGNTGLASATLFQTKLALYTSYVVGARVEKGRVPDALFWDTADPYHYLRLEPHRNHDLVIFGGEDHKTGQVSDTNACFDRLARTLRSMVGAVDVTYRWSGQVLETPDGLPYIGETAPRQFTGTGFSGNGMTFGTLTGMMAADRVLGHTNPWSDLFDPERKNVRVTVRVKGQERAEGSFTLQSVPANTVNVYGTCAPGTICVADGSKACNGAGACTPLTFRVESGRGEIALALLSDSAAARASGIHHLYPMETTGPQSFFEAPSVGGRLS